MTPDQIDQIDSAIQQLQSANESDLGNKDFDKASDDNAQVDQVVNDVVENFKIAENLKVDDTEADNNNAAALRSLEDSDENDYDSVNTDQEADIFD